VQHCLVGSEMCIRDRGEDIKLEEDEDDKASVSTEDELLQKAGESDVVALNL
jgi:hypothetical protein